ncbi:MAG: PASTA domain-containing protein [Oscillospiraceae bacterium]|nr:PASTA domain-containing protein [Oscillospiraceae bacterium]
MKSNAKHGRRRQTASDRMFQRAMIVLFALIFAGFGAGAYGLVSVQLVNGKEYAAKAEEGQLRDTELAAPRGAIYDSTYSPKKENVPFARSASAYKIYINPNALDKAINKAEILQALRNDLAPLLGISPEKIDRQASYTKYNYMALAGQIDNDTMKKVNAFRDRKLDIQLKTNDKDYAGGVKTLHSTYAYYVGVSPDIVRYYPMGSLAANVIGFTGADDIGRAGLELYYNKSLTGVPGRIVSAKNAADANLPVQFETQYNAKPGHSLVLTIDAAVQSTLERSLEQAKIDSKAKAAYGIVMDVKTGGILGMACVTSFDPGNYQHIADDNVRAQIEALPEGPERQKAYNQAMMAQWRNGTIELTYEPGSVFKCVTVSAGLEEHVVDLDTHYSCSGGIQVANRYIRCHKREGHGAQTLTQGLMNSCNPFMITIGQRLGVDKFYKYFEGFGFTESTGIDLPNEYFPKKGLNIHAQENMHIVELASCSFGQSFEASPVQILTAVSAIANGGKLMEPYVVAKELDENGRVIKETQPTVRRQVISEDTSQKVRSMMEQVVTGGTGKNGYVAGAHVAGKTGTSQKLSAGSGYVASFSCFAPADDPSVALLIAIDEPQGLINGGQIAAPPAAEIMENVLVHKNIEMRYTEKEQQELGGVAPDMTGKDADMADAALKKAEYRVRVIGGGGSVVHQIPEPGQSLTRGGLIILYTEGATAEETMQTVTVPKLTGLGIKQAAQIAADAGLNIKLTGNYESDALITYRQSVPAGDEARLGETITVHFVSNNGVTDRIA